MSEATKIFSFRGEFGQDVIVFKNRCKEEGIVIKNMTEDPYGSTPDVGVEIETTATKEVILDNVPKNLRQAVGARIFLTVRELNAAEDVFPDNGKRNLLLADDYTVDGIYRSLDKKKYDVPIKVLALAT